MTTQTADQVAIADGDARLNFKSADPHEFLAGIEEATRVMTIELRLARVIARKSKAELVSSILECRAAGQSPDAFFDTLAGFDDRLADLDRMRELLTTARTRMFSAMAAVAAELPQG